MAWTTRRWHKWIAVTSSLVLVMWCISGISLALPGSGIAPRPQGAADWRAASVPPRAAVAAAAALLGDSAAAPGTVQLRQLAGETVYYLGFSGARTAFVNAVSGQAFLMDSTVAARIAQQARGVPVRAVRMVREHGPTYAYGDLPVYVVEFEGGGPRAYVSARSGGVVLTTTGGLLRQGLAAMHDGRIVAVFAGESPATLLVAGFGVLTLVAALTGLWLALPAGWRRRRRGEAAV